MTTTLTQPPGSPIDHGARAHAKHSPSSLKYKELCPHWANKNSDTRHTEMGEKMHEAMEAWLRSEPSGTELPELEQFFLGKCREYVEPLLAGNEKVLVEQAVQMTDPWLGPLTRGTPDLQIFYDKNRMHIVDYKFGFRQVDAASVNLQAYAYIVAAFDMNPLVEHIAFHFVSPRQAEESNYAEFTRADYHRLKTRVGITVAQAEDPEAEYKPSWAACAYCGNKGACTKLISLMPAMKVDNQTEPLDAAACIDADTPDKRAQLYLLTDVVKDWVEQQRTRILELAMGGEEVEGFELRFRNGKTSVTNVSDVRKSLKKFKIPVDDLEKVATVSLANLETLACQGLGEREKSSRKREMMSLLASGSALKTGEDQPYLHRIK